MRHNIVRGEQIMPQTVNKAVIQEYKAIKFELDIVTLPVLHSPVLGFLPTFEKSELQTYRYTNRLLHVFSACAPRHY